MKLATLKNGGREGRLVVVSRDLQLAVAAEAVAPTMRHAIDHWAGVEAGLKALKKSKGENPLRDALGPIRDAYKKLPNVQRAHLLARVVAYITS